MGWLSGLVEKATSTFEDIGGDSDWGGVLNKAKEWASDDDGGDGGFLGGIWDKAETFVRSGGVSSTSDDDGGGWFDNVLDKGKQLFGEAAGGGNGEGDGGGFGWMSDITNTAKSWMGGSENGGESSWLNDLVTTGKQVLGGGDDGDSNGSWLDNIADKAGDWINKGLGDTFNPNAGGGFGDLGFKDLPNVIKTITGSDIPDIGLGGDLMQTGGQLIADAKNWAGDFGVEDLMQQGQQLWAASADQLPDMIQNMNASTLQNVIAQGGGELTDLVGKLDDGAMTSLLTKLATANPAATDSQLQTVADGPQRFDGTGLTSDGPPSGDLGDDVLGTGGNTGFVPPHLQSDADAPGIIATTVDPGGDPITGDPTFDAATSGPAADPMAADPTAGQPDMQIDEYVAPQDDFSQDIGVANEIEDSLGDLTSE
jgi:hypothetical protein